MGIDRQEQERRGGTRIVKGGRKIDPRPLQLKIRISARKGLIQTREDLLDLIESAIATHEVPEGVVIRWIDWKKGTGGKVRSGHIEEEVVKALEEFWLAVSHQDAKVRAARLEAKGREGKIRRVSLERPSKGGR